MAKTNMQLHLYPCACKMTDNGTSAYAIFHRDKLIVVVSGVVIVVLIGIMIMTIPLTATINLSR